MEKKEKLLMSKRKNVTENKEQTEKRDKEEKFTIKLLEYILNCL